MKGIDHLVLCGRSLDSMRKAYAGLGFTLTPPAQHPFGTQNSLVQLDGMFLELLSLGEGAKIPEHEEEQFSFAAFNCEFLKQQEGLSMLVLDSEDARRDIANYRRLGLRSYEPFDFSRRAKLASGEEAVVGFSLAFVSCPEMPMCGFFCCQQHAPQHFWQDIYQRHLNGARTVSEVVLVAERPRALGPFLEAFVGAQAKPDGTGVRIRTSRGDVAVMTHEEFENGYGAAAPDLSRGPRFAGYTIGVEHSHPPALPGRTIALFGAAIRFQMLPVAGGERHD